MPNYKECRPMVYFHYNRNSEECELDVSIKLPNDIKCDTANPPRLDTGFDYALLILHVSEEIGRAGETVTFNTIFFDRHLQIEDAGIEVKVKDPNNISYRAVKIRYDEADDMPFDDKD